MKKIIALSSIVSAAALLASCASYVPVGSLYTDATTGVSVNNNVSGAKVGKACSTSILGLVATGDASIAAAKRTAGITNVSTVDYTAHNVLGIYGQYCVVLHGN